MCRVTSSDRPCLSMLSKRWRVAEQSSGVNSSAPIGKLVTLSSYHVQTRARRVLAKHEPFGRSPWSRFSRILTFPRVTPRETLRSDILIRIRCKTRFDPWRSVIVFLINWTLRFERYHAIARITLEIFVHPPRYIVHPNARRVMLFKCTY